MIRVGLGLDDVNRFCNTVSHFATPAGRPLRRDAERNRQRILEAARRLVTARGLDISHDEIAREAGVAVGTVYRRFPEKQLLFDALFVERVAEVAALAEGSLLEHDAWSGLAGFLEGVFEMQAEDRGLREFMSRGRGTGLAATAASRIQPAVGELVRRAHADGTLRADIGPNDIPLIPLMVGAVMDSARHVEPDLWRRVLAVVLDGMSVGRGHPLPGTPLSVHALEGVLSGPSTRRS